MRKIGYLIVGFFLALATSAAALQGVDVSQSNTGLSGIMGNANGGAPCPSNQVPIGAGTGSSPTCSTAGQLGAILCVPSVSIFITGTNATYTTPTCNSVAATWLEIELVGGGGGGAGSGTTPGAAGAGTATCWKASGTACSTPLYVANGGGAGATSAGSTCTVATASGGDENYSGAQGGAGSNAAAPGGAGGNGPYGGGGASGGTTGGAGFAAQAAGSGGGGAGWGGATASGGGGCAGAYLRKILTSPAATYVYTVGALGSAGTAGTSGQNGGAGFAGQVRVVAHWQ